MKKLFLPAFCFLIAASYAVAAPTIEIKLASIAPEATAWGRALNRMAKEWSDATGGQVKLTVYHDGRLGSEERTVLQKLRGNQIQAAVISSVGMNSISKKLLTLSSPFLIRNNKEMDYVLSELGGELEGIIENSGYKLVAWSRVGWVRFFGRRPIAVPADLKAQKIAGPEDMPELNNMFKLLGYTVVPTTYNDVLIALTSNKVDAVFQIPPFVASMQLFGIAKNMMPLDICPVMGGIVMNETAWKRVPEKHRKKILDIARRIATENDAGAQKLTDDSIGAMLRNGLVQNTLSPAQEKLWSDEQIAAMPSLLGGRNSVLEPVIYRRVEDLLKKYRQK